MIHIMTHLEQEDKILSLVDLLNEIHITLITVYDYIVNLKYLKNISLKYYQM